MYMNLNTFAVFDGYLLSWYRSPPLFAGTRKKCKFLHSIAMRSENKM